MFFGTKLDYKWQDPYCIALACSRSRILRRNSWIETDVKREAVTGFGGIPSSSGQFHCKAFLGILEQSILCYHQRESKYGARRVARLLDCGIELGMDASTPPRLWFASQD